MKLFSTEEINTGRQFEFDLAKAVCILGMVFVHCFEVLAMEDLSDSSTAYYVMVIVLDAIFGAGTFMGCMGLGIAYSWKNNPDKLIRRGISIFLLGYLLNILRGAVPQLLLYALGYGADYLDYTLVELFCTDIMPFAGLALLLFGLLKKARLSDLWVLVIALIMSVAGSFLRFMDIGHYVVNDLAGLFFGTQDAFCEDTVAAFPLLNWFIVVVAGYLYGKLLRRCANKEKYYAIAFPVSGALLAAYMAVAIPNRLGMMCGELIYYYQMTTPDMLVLLLGAVFATCMYYYLGKLFSDKLKKIITRLSSNINTVYCIHWVMLGWLCFLQELFESDGFGDGGVFITGVLVYIAANLLAELVTRRKEKKSAAAAA